MAYIYKKTIGGKEYYYLRASVRKNNKTITKDIAYLGSDIDSVRNKLDELPSKYSAEIRKTYKTINKFIEVNIFLEKARASKLKNDSFLANENLENVEACKIHWQTKFSNLHKLTKEETFKTFIVEFAFNTTAIEGNTITLKQAQNLLHENLTPKNKTLREIYDIQNTEKVFLNLIDINDKLSHELICKIHDELLANIDSRKGYRTEDVRVIKATFKSTPARYVKTDMDLLLKWYYETEKSIHPFALAVIFHHKFEKIHPFMDGNGRTGRMLMNYILLKKDYPPAIIRKKNRSEFLKQLAKADGCELTKATKSHYSAIIEFCALEFYENYWNIFL
ncbi:MAG: Fic family protein [Nanoarchaeota archaeon]|nr:Fic family protein [Nanoarchaeota archaeon]